MGGRQLSNVGAGPLDKLAIYGSTLAFKLNLPVRARVMMAGQAVPVTLHDGADRAVLREVVQGGEYEAVSTPTPGVIVDVGANVGFTSLYFASRFPGAVIHAIEPSPPAYQRLLANTRHEPRIKAHRLAIGDVNGRARFNVSPDHMSSSFLDRGRNGVEAEVEVLTLVTFLAREAIDRVGLLKVDVEGYEGHVFRGMDAARINQIVAELHFDLMPVARDWYAEQLDGFEFAVRAFMGGQREMLLAKRKLP